MTLTGQPLETSSETGDEPAHTPGRFGRSRWWLVGAAAILTLILMVRWTGRNDAQLLTGEFALVDDGGFTGRTGACQGKGGYSDFGPGMNVTVRNGDGAIVATASTEPPDSDAEEVLSEVLYGNRACVVVWQTEVPHDEPFYEIEMGRRGALSYSHAQLVDNGWHVTASLGD